MNIYVSMKNCTSNNTLKYLNTTKVIMLQSHEIPHIIVIDFTMFLYGYEVILFGYFMSFWTVVLLSYTPR